MPSKDSAYKGKMSCRSRRVGGFNRTSNLPHVKEFLHDDELHVRA